MRRRRSRSSWAPPKSQLSYTLFAAALPKKPPILKEAYRQAGRTSHSGTPLPRHIRAHIPPHIPPQSPPYIPRFAFPNTFAFIHTFAFTHTRGWSRICCLATSWRKMNNYHYYYYMKHIAAVRPFGVSLKFLKMTAHPTVL